MTYVRFIPARAGNSENVQSWSVVETVHPRACGELADVGVGKTVMVGSSPRVRGTRGGHGRIVTGSRFIPARAGNSEPRLSADGLFSVHPRACGELIPAPSPPAS